MRCGPPVLDLRSHHGRRDKRFASRAGCARRRRLRQQASRRRRRLSQSPRSSTAPCSKMTAPTVREWINAHRQSGAHRPDRRRQELAGLGASATRRVATTARSSINACRRLFEAALALGRGDGRRSRVILRDLGRADRSFSIDWGLEPLEALAARPASICCRNPRANASGRRLHDDYLPASSRSDGTK